MNDDFIYETLGIDGEINIKKVNEQKSKRSGRKYVSVFQLSLAKQIGAVSGSKPISFRS